MNILELIKKDHDEALALIKRLEKLSEKPTKATWMLTKELVEEVLLHSKVEEKILYRALREKNKDFRDFTLEGLIEHKLLESTMKQLLKLKPGKDGRFKASLTVVKELLEHHGKDEEEKEIFPKVRKAFRKTELDEMGQKFLALKEELRPSILMKLTHRAGMAQIISGSRQTLH